MDKLCDYVDHSDSDSDNLRVRVRDVSALDLPHEKAALFGIQASAESHGDRIHSYRLRTGFVLQCHDLPLLK